VGTAVLQIICWSFVMFMLFSLLMANNITWPADGFVFLRSQGRIVSKSQYRLFSFESSSEWSNSVQARFLSGSACNLSN